MIVAIIAGQNDDALMALLRVFTRNITNSTCPELQQVAEKVLQALNSWLWWPRDQREKYQTVPRWSLSSTFHCYLHTSFLSVRPVVLCSLAECTMTCSVVCPIWGTCAITYFNDSCKHWTLKQQFREGMGGREGEGERGGRERERESFLLLQWLPLQWLVFWDLVFTPIQFPPRLLVPVPPSLPFFNLILLFLSPLLSTVRSALIASVFCSNISQMNLSDVLLPDLLAVCSYMYNWMMYALSASGTMNTQGLV